MKPILFRSLNFVLLSVMLPLISGCIGGGGDASLLGSLFGASSDGSTFVVSGGDGAQLASVHHPEPMTMLLVGGGTMTMAYLRNKKK